ncbi:MAG: GntR family transcriptional regulator [Verrucomicrobiae bacterium]|nr:GntR family transcriptional regulator [Verrucomicrobiae bacterium]
MKLEFNFSAQTAEPVHAQIERFLLEQMRTGRLPPHTRFPTTDELAHQWRVGHRCVQQAMDHLVAQGFIERRRKQGTFVKATDRRMVIGLVIGPKLTDEPRYFQRAIFDHLRGDMRQTEVRHWTYRLYDSLSNLGSKEDFRQSHEFQRLTEDCQTGVLKGTIQILMRQDIELAKQTFGLPVARFNPPAPDLKTDVVLDYGDFGRQCVEFLAGKGIRRAVYFRTLTDEPDDLMDLEGIKAANAGKKLALEIKPLARQELECPELEPQWEEPIYRQVLQIIDQWERKKQWPEALMVSDDVVMRPVAMALLRAAGAQLDRLTVITMASECIHHHYGLPVARYEWSLQALVRELLDILQRRMEGGDAKGLPRKLTGHLAVAR